MLKILFADHPHHDGQLRRKTLEGMGHDVFFFDWVGEQILSGKLSPLKKYLRWLKKIVNPYKFEAFQNMENKLMNTKLLEAYRSFKPDLLLVMKGSSIHPEILDEIKCVKICWWGDPIPHEQKDLLSKLSKLYDFLFIIDELEMFRGVRTYGYIETLPQAIDTKFYRPEIVTREDVRKYGSDVSFIGSIHQKRKLFLEGVKIVCDEQKASFKIWGGWQVDKSQLMENYCGRVHLKGMMKIYSCSKINLNIHGFGMDKSKFNGLPQRVFEVTACGGFLLTDDCVQIRRLFDIGEEVDVYKSNEELSEMIRLYLKDKWTRVSMADKARRRTLSEHTWEKRFTHIIKTAM